METLPGKLRPTRYAHTEGITDICYSDDGKHIITCGSDGDVRLFEGLDDDDCKSHTVADEAYCVAYQKDGILLVGTDLNMVQSYTADEGKTCGIITRFTSQPTHIQISKDKNLVAAASSDMSVKVHDVAAYKDLTFTGHKAPVLSVSIDPKGDFLASSSCDGTVIVWNFHTQTVVRSFPIVPKSNSYTNSITLCRLTFTPDGEYLIIPVEKQLHIYKRSTWKMVFTLQDPSVSKEISVASISACGIYVAGGCRDGQIIIWNFASKSVVANDKTTGGRAITGLVFNPSSKCELAFVNANGELGTFENYIQSESTLLTVEEIVNNELSNVKNDENRPSSANGYLPMDEDLDDDDNSISLSKIKNQMGFADDEEGTYIGSAQVPELENRPESRLTSVAPPPQIVAPTFPEPQTPFQPGMSPESHTDRYMVWNITGIVRQYRSEDENSIEVEFHDSQIHHPLHINTVPGQPTPKMAALNEQALVLGIESEDDQLSKLEVHHFSAWDGSKKWETNFPEGEDILAITVGNGWIAAATDKRNLRIFSTAGVQLGVFSLSGPVVCLAGKNQQLMVIYHSGIGVLGQQNLSAVIINIRGRRHMLGTQTPTPLSPNAFLVWAGFTDEGSPLIMDSAGIVRLFTGSMGSLWTVVLNSKKYAKGKSDHYFLIGASELQGMMRCIFCRGSRYPPVVPKPHVTLLELKIPLCEPDEEKSVLEESLIQAKMVSQMVDSIGESNSTEDSLREINKKLKESMIKLFALACRSDKESRALEVCESMSSPELIELAIKYSSKTHKMQLAERLGSVVEAKIKERNLENDDLYHGNSFEEEEEVVSTPEQQITNSESSPTANNPLLNALQRRNSFKDPGFGSSPNQINPFRKSSDSPSASSRGIAILDSLKATKPKEAPILRPVMRKPKSKMATPETKAINPFSAAKRDGSSPLVDISSTKENDKPLVNEVPRKKVSALKLWFEDNKEIVLEKYPDVTDNQMMAKAAFIFKDVDDSIKQKYKTLATENNKTIDNSNNEDKKRVSESIAEGEPVVKKIKSTGISKLSSFAFSPKAK